MQQHPHRETLTSIISALQTRTAARLTTHIDNKIKAHNNSMGNDIAYHLTNTVVDGQLLAAIHFRIAHTHLGRWT
jgi:hypothetical protein